jgi:hypothetical protein
MVRRDASRSVAVAASLINRSIISPAGSIASAKPAAELIEIIPVCHSPLE